MTDAVIYPLDQVPAGLRGYPVSKREHATPDWHPTSGAYDRFGRQLGRLVSRWEITGFEVRGEGLGGYEPGFKRFQAIISSARNGEGYGSGQTRKSFDTAAEREAFITKTIREGAKRDLKAAEKDRAKLKKA